MIELLILKGADVDAKDILYQNKIKIFLIMIFQYERRKSKKNNKRPIDLADEEMRAVILSAPKASSSCCLLL